MTKKILSFLLLAIVFVFSFASCGEEHVHDFDNWETVKEASCTEKGVKTRYCSCGEEQTLSIEKAAHVFKLICGSS